MAYFKEPQEFRILSGKNLYFKTHFHPQVEIILCTLGEIELTIEQTTYLLKQNECAIIFPNQSHSYMRRHEDLPSKAWLAIIPMHFVEDFEAELDSTYPVYPILKGTQLPPHFLNLFEALYSSFSQNASNTRLYRAFSNLMLAYLIPELTLKSSMHSYDLALTPRILNYLAANLSEPLPLAQVAKAFGISKNTLSHIFAKELNTTYLTYITSLRIEAAKKLLCKTTHSISCIASESGFQSERSFYRSFRSHMNCSPAQYRRQHISAKK